MEETTNNSLNITRAISLSPKAISFLFEIGKWCYFLSILGFVMVGFMILAGLFAGSIFANIPGGDALPFSGAMIGIIYTIMGAIYFFPALFLYKFSIKIKSSLKTNNAEELEEGLENLKSHYKFIGILALVMLSFYLLIFVVSILGALFASSL